MQGLQFAELSVAYGGSFEKAVNKRKKEEILIKLGEIADEQSDDKKFKKKLKVETCEQPANLPSYQQVRDLEFCKDLKPGQKLRVVDGFLKVDKRIMQCVARAFSRDNRYKTLEHLKTLCEKYENNYELMEAIEKLKITYKDDKEFCTLGNPVYKQIKDLEFCKDLRIGQKLRLVDGFLKVDKRIMQCVSRTFSKDNRDKIVNHLGKLYKEHESYQLAEAIEKLKVTYKDDKHFLERLNIISYTCPLPLPDRDTDSETFKILEENMSYPSLSKAIQIY